VLPIPPPWKPDAAFDRLVYDREFHAAVLTAKPKWNKRVGLVAQPRDASPVPSSTVAEAAP
jgi:hypothetical protein